MVLLLPLPAKGAADSGGIRIEQVRIYMPDIKVYYYSDDPSAAGAAASLSDQNLAVVSSYPYQEDKSGIDYYLLVDISSSISREYFADIRQALVHFPEGMRDEDRLTVVTFGDQVSVVLDKAAKTDDIAGKLGVLENPDMNTSLFEAAARTASLADKEENICRRSAAIMISDGEDCSSGSITKKKALKNLRKAGLPLYAMAVKENSRGDANEFIEDFGDFARRAQGELSVFGEGEALACVRKIQDTLHTAQVLELKAPGNRLTSVMQPFTLSIPGEGSAAVKVYPRYYQRDAQEPEAAVEQISEKELRIAYSEPVRNAERESSYRITRGVEEVPVYDADYRDEEMAAVLTFQDALPGGRYHVAFQDICDLSMEENPLRKEISFSVEGTAETDTEFLIQTESETESETENETGTEREPRGGRGSFRIFSFFPVCILLMAAAASAALLFASRRRPYKKDSGPPSGQNRLKCRIRSRTGERTMEIAMGDRLMAGRSLSCDLVLPDKLLSRRHFILEKDSGFFYITDCGTTNGTMVNGIRIVSRCRLKNGDVIQAGSLYITITW